MAQQVPHTPFAERHKLAGRRRVKSSHAGGVHVATCQRPPCIISRRRHYGMASCWMVPSVLLNVVWWRLLRHRPQTTTSTLLAQVGRTPLRLAIRLSEQRPNACCGRWHLVRVPQSRRWRSRNELPARAPQCLRRCATRLPCRGMVRPHHGGVCRNVAFPLAHTHVGVPTFSDFRSKPACGMPRHTMATAGSRQQIRVPSAGFMDANVFHAPRPYTDAHVATDDALQSLLAFVSSWRDVAGETRVTRRSELQLLGIAADMFCVTQSQLVTMMRRFVHKRQQLVLVGAYV